MVPAIKRESIVSQETCQLLAASNDVMATRLRTATILNFDISAYSRIPILFSLVIWDLIVEERLFRSRIIITSS